MPVKVTFHMPGGDFTMTFQGQKTFKKISHSKFRTLLLWESEDVMSPDLQAWLDYALEHGGGPSVPKCRTTVIEYDENGNIVEQYFCSETSPRRWFTKYDTIREIEMDYIKKTKIKEYEQGKQEHTNL